jgi:transposase
LDLRCAGLDVHKKTVVACVLITHPDGTLQREVRTFSTMTADLLLLSDWLETLRVQIVALESTGVFWQPVFNLLEDGRTMVLVNPQHIKAVPGRKTDVKDSEWLADLLRHGLLTPSFIPPAPIRELRELTRYRKHLVEARAREVNRVQKVLEGANIKLSSVATDVLGKSGRAMLEALIEGRAGSGPPFRTGPWAHALETARTAAGPGWATPGTAPHPAPASVSPHRLSRPVDRRAGSRD